MVMGIVLTGLLNSPGSVSVLRSIGRNIEMLADAPAGDLMAEYESKGESNTTGSFFSNYRQLPL